MKIPKAKKPKKKIRFSDKQHVEMELNSIMSRYGIKKKDLQKILRELEYQKMLDTENG